MPLLTTVWQAAKTAADLRNSDDLPQSVLDALTDLEQAGLSWRHLRDLRDHAEAKAANPRKVIGTLRSLQATLQTIDVHPDINLNIQQRLDGRPPTSTTTPGTNPEVLEAYLCNIAYQQLCDHHNIAPLATAPELTTQQLQTIADQPFDGHTANLARTELHDRNTQAAA